jgi:polyene glycosyltransferase
LFCCTHSTGEANTSLALAGELARRGVEDLWFASDENHRAAVAALADKSAVSFASLGEVNPRLALTMLDEKAYGSIMQRSRIKTIRARTTTLMDAEHHFDRYRRLDALVEEIKPALMVINRFCTFATQIALTRGIPYVLTAPCLPSDLLGDDLPPDFPRPSSGLPRTMTLAQRLANRRFRLRTQTLMFRPAILRKIAEYSKQFAAHGVDHRVSRTRTQIESARLLLCFSLFGLDYPFPVPSHLRLLGAMIPPPARDPQDEDVLRWLDEHRSVVYIAFGSVTRLSRDEVGSMLEVVRGLGDEHNVLWMLPQEQHRLLPEPGELPGNLRIERWIHSQHGVLAHRNVRAFFTHGGSNSFHEGVYFGKPLLVRPVCIDQYDHAVRAVDSGVGLAVARPDTVDPADVRGKLGRLLEEESFRERAEHFGRLQQETGGIRTAGDLILECVPSEDRTREPEAS